jgi:hypothetical protein
MDFFATSVLAFAFAALLPTALLSALRYVGRTRRKRLRSLLESSPRLASTFFGEYAAYKYDLFQNAVFSEEGGRIRHSFGTMLVAVFILLTGACFAFAAMLATHPEVLDKLNILLVGFGTADNLTQYQQATAKFYTLTFAVSYIWSIYFLLHRVSNYTLTPVHFLDASLQIVVAIFLAYILWPIFAMLFHEKFAVPTLTIASVAIGLHRPLQSALLNNGRRLLDKLRRRGWWQTRRYKKPQAEAVPLHALDGADRSIVDALRVSGIDDVAALAMASPVLLSVEASVELHQSINLVAQAQLAYTVGTNKFVQLKYLGVRTVFDLELLADCCNSSVSQTAAAIILADDVSGSPLSKEWQANLQFFVTRVKANLHVQRLFHVQANLRVPHDLLPKQTEEIGRIAAGELEQRVIKTITNALSAPTLIQYSGWVQAKLEFESARSGQLTIFVRFFEHRPEWGTTAEVRIPEGTKADWVDFDLELRAGLDQASTVRMPVDVPASGNSKEFVLKVPYDYASRPEIWLQIFQRNRLIQALKLNKAGEDDAASGEPRSASSSPSES